MKKIKFKTEEERQKAITDNLGLYLTEIQDHIVGYDNGEEIREKSLIFSTKPLPDSPKSKIELLHDEIIVLKQRVDVIEKIKV